MFKTYFSCVAFTWTWQFKYQQHLINKQRSLLRKDQKNFSCVFQMLPYSLKLSNPIFRIILAGDVDPTCIKQSSVDVDVPSLMVLNSMVSYF